MEALKFALVAALLALGSAGLGSILLSMNSNSSTASASVENRFPGNARRRPR